MKTVWMSHPGLPDGQDIEVPEQSVTIYGMSGWVLRDDPPEPVDQPVEVDVHGQPKSATADTEESQPETKTKSGAKGSSKSASSAKGDDS